MNATEQTIERLEEHGDSARRWFGRGFAGGVLLMSAINALSYFVRSETWQEIGFDAPGKRANPETLGFPFQIWESGNFYEGFYVDYPMLGMNFLVACVASAIVGAFVASRTTVWNGMIRSVRAGFTEQSHQPLQFSLSGLLLTTAVAAIAVALARSFAARRETLIAIYLLGPLCLVAIAMLPRSLSWQTRVKLIIPLTIGMIGSAIAVGVAIDLEFDKVLLGIFLCWTPQSALAAAALTCFLVYQLLRHERIDTHTGGSIVDRK